MAEKVILRQNMRLEVEFLYSNPDDPESGVYHSVEGLHEITPYGMMLFSLGECTAQVVLSYAQHHGIPLEEVEFRIEYDRIYKEDCDDCENINRYDEKIIQKLKFIGDLDEDVSNKLYKIAHQCPIEKMFEQGIKIESEHILE